MQVMKESMADRAMAPTGKADSSISPQTTMEYNLINPLKTQMTLQQLQKMAERQRTQILRNNQELIAKQQRLMEMQSGMKKQSQVSQKPNTNDAYATKLRETYQSHLSRLRDMKMVQDEVDSKRFNNIELAHELERVREIFSAKQKELVSAAAKVDNLTKQLDGRRMGLSSARATPEKLNRRRKIRAAREELDKLRKELSTRNEMNNQQEVQLQVQKESLTEKRRELSELDKKINLLGSQLHPNSVSDNDSDASTSSELLNGDVNGNSRFGSGQIFDTLQKKKLTDRILRNDARAMPSPDGRMDISGKTQSGHVPYIRRGKFYVAPDGREFDRPPTVEDYPEFATGSQTSLNTMPVPNNVPVRSASFDSISNLRGGSPHLPRSRTDVLPSLQVNNSTGKLVSQQKAASISVLGPPSPSFTGKEVKFSVHSPSSSLSSLSSITSADIDINKQGQKPTVAVGGRIPGDVEIWTESTDFRTSSPISLDKVTSPVYSDLLLSKCAEACNGKVFRYLDCPKSDATEVMVFQNTVASKQVLPMSEEQQKALEEVGEKGEADEKPPPLPRKAPKPEVPKKPVVAPKPALPPKKKNLIEQNVDQQTPDASADEVNDFKEKFTHSRQPNMSELTDDINKMSVQDLVEQFKDAMPGVKQVADGEMADLEREESFLGPSNGYGDAYNPNDPYQISYADIDMISATQNDILPYFDKGNDDQQSEQSINDSSSQIVEHEQPVLPVIISVPPEKMPPTILKKPGRDNKKRGRIQLDPHALLLDAALEGEISLVKEMVHRVPDPSFSNAEGITALHNAVCGNHKEVVRLLVEIGCDINSPDNNGWTPLHCAAFYNDMELCKFLVEHGASVYAMTYSDRQTAAEKCSRLEDNYDQCFGFLHECKEQVGRINNGEVCSLYDYTAENEDELSFHCGEQLRILRRGDANEREWWWAESKKKETGYVPFNLLGIHPRIAGEV